MEIISLAARSALRGIVSAVACTIAASALAAPPDRRPIDRAVSVLIRELSDGIAVGYPEFRNVRFGHLFGTRTQDAVAFFSIEAFGGTNYHAEYIAFFASVPHDTVGGKTTRPYRLVAVTQIGGRGWRTFDGKTAVLKPQAVTLSGSRWAEGDPGCCPSEPIVATFHIENGNISEAK